MQSLAMGFMEQVIQHLAECFAMPMQKLLAGSDMMALQ